MKIVLILQTLLFAIAPAPALAQSLPAVDACGLPKSGTINASVTYILTADCTQTGELNVSSSVPGSQVILTIEGNGYTITGDKRQFSVIKAGTRGGFVLRNLTIAEAGLGGGAAVDIDSVVPSSLTNVTLYDTEPGAILVRQGAHSFSNILIDRATGDYYTYTHAPAAVDVTGTGDLTLNNLVVRGSLHGNAAIGSRRQDRNDLTLPVGKVTITGCFTVDYVFPQIFYGAVTDNSTGPCSGTIGNGGASARKFLHPSRAACGLPASGRLDRSEVYTLTGDCQQTGRITIRAGLTVTINGNGHTIHCASSGSIFIMTAGRLTIRNAIIDGCVGSPMWLFLRTPTRIENSIFRNHGGPFYIVDSEIVFDRVLWEDNTHAGSQTYQASALDIQLAADVTLRGSIVRDNSGGMAALRIRSSSLETPAVTIEGCSSFENNNPQDISDAPGVLVDTSTGPCDEIVVAPARPTASQSPPDELSGMEILIKTPTVCASPADVRAISMGAFACLFIHGVGADATLDVYGIDPATSAGFHLLTVTQAQIDAYDGEAIVAISTGGRILVLRWEDGNVSTFNPVLSSDGASFQAYSLLWPKPYEIDPMSYDPIPGLTTWEAADDGLSYTFHIRDDANWSDGVAITSHDMKFVVDAIKSPEVGSWRAADFANVEGVEVIDDKTFRVVLSEADCTVFAELGGTRLMPAHRFEADFSDFKNGEISTNPLEISGGPYIMDAYEPAEFQSYYANPTWWGGDVGIPYLINRNVGSHELAAQSLQAGEIDYTYLHGDIFAQIADTSNLQWQIFPQMSVKFMSLNWADPTQPTAAFDADGNRQDQPAHPILTDVNVRKAIAMGYNKFDILATMGGDQGGTRLVGAVNPYHAAAYNTDIEPYPYDPEAAMQLLEEAGWVDEDGDGVREKDGQRLTLNIPYSDILTMFPTTTLIAQDQLKDIGVEVTVELVEWANYLSTVLFGQEHDGTSMSNSGGTGGAPDPNDFMGILNSRQDNGANRGGSNTSSYVNPEVDDLIDEARTLPGCDPVERGEIYKEIQRISHEEVAYDWTFVPNIWQTATKRVQGFEPTAFWVFYGYTADIHKWTLAE